MNGDKTAPDNEPICKKIILQLTKLFLTHKVDNDQEKCWDSQTNKVPA